MSKLRVEKKYEGQSPDDCFEASKTAFPKAGFEIFKIRDIAWLVIAHKPEDGSLIEANIGARPPAVSATVTFTVSCDDLDKSALQIHLDAIMHAFESELANI